MKLATRGGQDEGGYGAKIRAEEMQEDSDLGARSVRTGGLHQPDFLRMINERSLNTAQSLHTSTRPQILLC